jgi:hypothetical protein
MRPETSKLNFEQLTISIFLKIPPVGAEFPNADGQRDMAMLIVTFYNVTNGPKVVGLYVHFRSHRHLWSGIALI